MAAVRFFAPDGTGLIAFAFVVAGFASALALGCAVARRGEEWSGQRRARRALDRVEARGEPTLGSEAVGVSYAEGRWRADLLGDAWDWGGLRVDLDRLVFVGEHSRFELRPQDVVDTEVRRIDPGLGGSQPRLYLRYRTGGGVASVGLDLPYLRSAHRRVEQTVGLQARIERWRSEPLPTPNARPALRPRPEDAAAPRPSRFMAIGRPAKLFAAFAAFPSLLGVMVAFELAADVLFGRHSMANGAIAGGTPMFGMVLWITLAAKIETRLPTRWRYPQPPLDLETAIEERSEEVHLPVPRSDAR